MSRHRSGAAPSNSEMQSFTTLNAISNRRRQRILNHLRDSDGTMLLDDLVTTLSTDDQPAQSINSDEMRPDDVAAEAATNGRTMRIRLHHVDLPALAATGLIEYDRERKRVRTITD